MSKGKVVLVGSAHTGKTSMINRFVHGEFTPHVTPTTQPACVQKRIFLEGCEFTLEIWDTAGQEQYHALGPMFYRDAEAGIVVFDVTDQTTFAKCNQWISELRQARGQSVQIYIAGNKSDLQSVRTVPLDAASNLASAHGGQCFITSAKTGENIDLMFGTVAKALSQKPPPQEGPSATAKRKSNVRFDQLPDEPQGCC